MYDNKMKKQDKLKSFQQNASSLFELYPKDISFRKTDLVFFPVCRHNHFFVPVFDLKVPTLLILDNASLVSNFNAKYAKFCNLVQHCLGEHLKMQNHPMAMMIKNMHLHRIKIP
ncbi:uncharacterized protein [Rutidosis leptorrhynchoides]|uniref:uncharacterized protein n=1 Tax=Rutidosis leptorrhynchoides TaxID=125765 RepID=UPI003A99B963